MPKTVTTTAGETFHLDFFCERRLAHMTFIGCERMQDAARRQKEKTDHIQGRIQRHLLSTCIAFGDDPCLSCSQGLEIAGRNHQRRTSAPGDPHPAARSCLWENCSGRVHALGLCQRHARALRRNRLIQVNTADIGAGAMREFLEKLTQMAAETHMTIADVALAAMDEGVRVYFKRRQAHAQE